MQLPRLLRSRNVWFPAGVLAWSALFLACASVDRTIIAPPNVAAGAFVGTAECATCHGDVTDHFKGATHQGLTLNGDKKGLDISCEACHGPGAKHVESGGGKGTMINPKKSSETCYSCHLDKRGDFSLPSSHPVKSGKMQCADCHEPHKGKAVATGGTQLGALNETCLNCHTAQRGPFVYDHEATREGCTVCHSPHGSVNAKMLKTRNQNLCLQCHFEIQAGGKLLIDNGDHASRLNRGTCWSAGCHEAVHGSHVNNALRY